MKQREIKLEKEKSQEKIGWTEVWRTALCPKFLHNGPLCGIYLDVVGRLACPSGPDKMIPAVGWCGSPVPPARGIARRGPSCVGWRVPGLVGIEAGAFARRYGANFRCHEGCLLNWVIPWGTRYPAAALSLFYRSGRRFNRDPQCHFPY